ncbi:LysR family transcriptional regulator [Acidocella sp.]|jgi:LysR family nitrogen assimilation transcriptional regulator|uniref:LysR family transcriptional regulator n=1 Tax=Acidocella sp. TaxID=50710 RepID=UPI002F3F0688
MNLRAMKYFVAIVDAGSLTAASGAISIAQPALTRQLRELEKDLGVQLLHRTPHGVHLTPAGATLYEASCRILADTQQVREQLTGRQNNARKAAVVLGISPTLARLLVPGVFARCRNSPDDVKLTIREAFTPVLLDGLERGVIDIAIVTNPEPSRTLTMHTLLGEPFALMTPASKRLSQVISLSELARIPVLMTTLHRGLVELQLAPLGGRLNVQSEIDSVDAIREMVLQGQGSTLMPVSVFTDPHARPPVMMSVISGAPLNRILVMATRTKHEKNFALSMLKDVIIAELAELTQAGTFNLAPFHQPS